MKILPSSVIAVFCNDVRNEVGGTRSLVGVYKTELRVAEFPFSPPQLMVHLRAIFDVNVPIKSFGCVIYYRDEVMSLHPAPDEFVAKAFANAVRREMTQAQLVTSVKIRDLKVEEPSRIIVSALIDGEEFEVGHLRIEQKPSASKVTS